MPKKFATIGAIRQMDVRPIINLLAEGKETEAKQEFDKLMAQVKDKPKEYEAVHLAMKLRRDANEQKESNKCPIS